LIKVWPDFKKKAFHQKSDPTLVKYAQLLKEDPAKYSEKYCLNKEILSCKDAKYHPYWRVMIPTNLGYPLIKYVHTSMGHAGTEKCMHQIAGKFFLKNLGRNIRKYVSSCDICQRVKHPNRAFDLEIKSHVPSNPGELLTIDLYGPLPTGRGGVKYLLVCLDMFIKYVKLYPLKTATTKSCLNKLLNHYFIKINKPKVIRIYCNETHKKWPELIPHIEIWMNSSLSTSTKCTPVELMEKTNKLELFNVFRLPSTTPHEQKDLPTKLLEVYARLKGKADRRKQEKKERKFKRNFKVGDLVFVKCHHASEATQGIIGKFQRPFEGPFTLSKQINPNMFELKDGDGLPRGWFHELHLKPYLVAREASLAGSDKNGTS
jgi:hypothetical protein